MAAGAGGVSLVSAAVSPPDLTTLVAPESHVVNTSVSSSVTGSENTVIAAGTNELCHQHSEPEPELEQSRQVSSKIF